MIMYPTFGYMITSNTLVSRSSTISVLNAVRPIPNAILFICIVRRRSSPPAFDRIPSVERLRSAADSESGVVSVGHRSTVAIWTTTRRGAATFWKVESVDLRSENTGYSWRRKSSMQAARN